MGPTHEVDATVLGAATVGVARRETLAVGVSEVLAMGLAVCRGVAVG